MRGLEIRLKATDIIIIISRLASSRRLTPQYRASACSSTLNYIFPYVNYIFPVVKTIFYERAQRVSIITLFLTREDKI